MSTPRALLPALVLACAALGCKADEPSIDSGVDGGKQADQLDPTEQAQLCEAATAYGEQVITEAELKRSLCTAQAIAFALLQDGSVETCVLLRDGCLDAPEETTGGTEMCDLGIDWANCTATVAEIEACYEEYTKQSDAALGSLSCDKMAEYKADPPSSESPPLGEACSRAKAKCPSVIPVSGMDMP